MKIYLAGEHPPTVADADRNGNILIRNAKNGMFAERPWNCELDDDQEWTHTFFWQ